MTDAELYRENGYLHVRGVFSADEVEEMRAAIERILTGVAGTEDDENHTWSAVQQEAVLKAFHDVQYHDAAFTRAVAHPRLVSVLTQLIGPNVQLHHTKMLVKPPEQGAPFPMHQDYPYFPHERHTVVAASVHLDDADEENGCLRVVAGSHKQGPLEAQGPSHTVDVPLEEGTPVPAAAGDVLFQYRDPEDPPVLRDGIEPHVNWGQGLMVAGHNPVYWQHRPRFEIKAA